MKVISFTNHKGGVSKTTSALNIGAGLARMGKQVLLIDLDPQMNLSQGVGIQSSEKSIYEAMSGKCRLTPVPITDNLSLIPSSHELRRVESEFITRIGGQVRLRKLLSDIEGFDIVLIDCPPSLGLLTTNALSASTDVVIPMNPEFYSVQGVADLKQVVEEIRENNNESLTLSGIIISQYNKQKIVHRDICQIIEKMFGDIVFKTRIRTSVAIEEAPYQGQDVFRYSPNSNGAKDYQALCDEFVQRFLM